MVIRQTSDLKKGHSEKFILESFEIIVEFKFTKPI